MERLEELERKVRQMIQRNQELKQEIIALRHAHESVMQMNLQLEASVMKEASRLELLTQEKVAIKTTIDELLESIALLEVDGQ